MLYSFGPFELDLATYELRRDGRTLPLQPRVFSMLRYLIEHRTAGQFGGSLSLVVRDAQIARSSANTRR